MAKLLDLGEFRARREDAARPDPDHATDELRAENLKYARAYLHRITGTEILDELEPAGPGPCDDCLQDRIGGLPVPETPHRYVLGTLALCERCALLRATVYQRAREPGRDEHPVIERPADLARWLKVNATRLTPRGLTLWLEDWNIAAPLVERALAYQARRLEEAKAAARPGRRNPR